MRTAIEEIVDGIREGALETSIVESTVNVKSGQGLRAHKVNIDLQPFVANLPDGTSRKSWIGGFGAGVRAVVGEPARSRAIEWPFERAAVRILPEVHHKAFIEGVEAANDGDTPFTLPLVDDLVIAYIMALDQGYRPVTKGQVANWGATSDRVSGAGRSLLFHKSYGLQWTTDDGVNRLGLDDSAAARILIFEDLFFTELTSAEIAFALPTTQHFIFVNGQTPKNLAALKSAAILAFEESDYPLSPAIFGFQRGLPVPLEH